MTTPCDDERLYQRQLERNYKQDATLGDDGPPDETQADLDECDDDLDRANEVCDG